MELLEDSNSWLRRTRYSTAVYHRMLSSQITSSALTKPSSKPKEQDSSVASVSIPCTQERISKENTSHMKSTSLLNLKSNPLRDNTEKVQTDSNSKTRRKSLAFNLRPVSPVPTTVISDVFREAKEAAKRRFATPPPRERVGARTVKSPTKPKKESRWSKKYFDNGASRVSALVTPSEVDWSVDMSQLYLGKKFASGAHSRLYLGIYKGEEVAVKLIRGPQFDNDENRAMSTMLEKQYEREVACLSHLSHSNVIKLVGASKNPPVFCIITEYLAGGSLRSFLHKQNHASLPLPEFISIALGVARGMEYIHSQGVVHRDLKPENILLDCSANCAGINVKIADFGISCEERLCEEVDEDDSGTYRWMAPEMVRHQTYCRKVDVYSFGLLLWEMISGRMPFEEMTPIQAAFAVVDKNLRPPMPCDCPMALRALIEQCWALRPEKRPEFWQIMKVLEQCQLALVETGSLDSVKHVTCQDQKKWIHKLIQKLKPSSTSANSN